MKILKQITIVFLLCWLGEVISALLPFAFPGSIVAMLLLLGCLSTSLLRIEDISGFAGFLLANMAFFFIRACRFWTASGRSKMICFRSWR